MTIAEYVEYEKKMNRNHISNTKSYLPTYFSKSTPTHDPIWKFSHYFGPNQPDVKSNYDSKDIEEEVEFMTGDEVVMSEQEESNPGNTQNIQHFEEKDDIDKWLNAEIAKHMSMQGVENTEDALISIIKSIKKEMKDDIMKKQFETLTASISNETSSITSNEVDKDDNHTSITASHNNLHESDREFIFNEWILDSYDVDEEYAREIGDLCSRRFNEYNRMFKNEIENLSNEYILRIGKKGYVLDDVWEKCQQNYKKTNEAWHDEAYEEDEMWHIGDEKTDYDPPYVNIETFEVKKYSFKGGHSFICITDHEDEALPLGRVNGARFKNTEARRQLSRPSRLIIIWTLWVCSLEALTRLNSSTWATKWFKRLVLYAKYNRDSYERDKELVGRQKYRFPPNFKSSSNDQGVSCSLPVSASLAEHQKLRVLAPEKSEVVTRDVTEWVKDGIIGRNLEAYVDDIVIKSNDEKMLLANVAETFDNLRKINMKLNLKKCSFGVEEGKFLSYMASSEAICANLKKTSILADIQSPRMLKEMQSLAEKLAALNSPIQVVSRTLNEAERDYAPMEKLALSLLHMTRRYFEAHLVKVIINQPIKQILRKTNAFRLLAKYVVELGDYDITFEPRNAVKGQVLADFITEMPDGEASSSKGSRAGSVLISPSGVEHTYALQLTFDRTNNEAEYRHF
ncbi:hypothetical protein Tco_1561567 [Tanacetum coccineum]